MNKFVTMDSTEAKEKKSLEEQCAETGEKLKTVENQICWENCDFERAIDATGYGKYNVFLLALTVFPMLSGLGATSTMSLALPSAECDLGLTNFHKGLINSITYTGMICSAFFWGFLSDTLGRQKLLVICFALDFVFNMTAALAQNFETLFTAKLLHGFICSGPFAILMTYLAECHSAKYRATIIQWTGVFSALGAVTLPLVAWVIIPQPWYIEVLSLKLPSWRMYLVLFTLPAVLSSTSFYFQHESPKFLMSRGRNDEAMAAFQTIYAVNSGKPKSTYPVKSLIVEKVLDTEKSLKGNDESGKSAARFFSEGWQQIKPLFHPPHRKNAALIFLFQGGTLFGVSTLRLWMPQLFASILRNQHLSANASTVCELLVGPHLATNVTRDCSTYMVNSQVYINSIIIGTVTAAGCLTSGYIIKVFGKNWPIIVCTATAAVSCMLMYWATSSRLMLTLSSLFITLGNITSVAIISVAVDLFPTSLRTMAVSLTMMVGRTGAMIGNLLIPVLLDWDCRVPFFLIAAILSLADIMVFFVPNTKGKPLE